MKTYCIYSGNYFTFSCGENTEQAITGHITRMLLTRSGSLGDEIIVKDDYNGKILERVDTKEFLQSHYPHVLTKITADGKIRAFIPGLPGSDKWERCQGIYQVGTPMSKIGKKYWIPRGAMQNPFTCNSLSGRKKSKKSIIKFLENTY